MSNVIELQGEENFNNNVLNSCHQYAKERVKYPVDIVSTPMTVNQMRDQIDQYMTKHQGKKTIIIIAHRLSTIKKVDNIYLLDKGKIIEKGSYDDLKNDKNSKFSEIVELQLL